MCPRNCKCGIRRIGLHSLRLSADAQEALLAHDWPGNIRELEHLIGRSALQALGKYPERPRILTLTAEDFNLKTVTAMASLPAAATALVAETSLKDAVAAYERSLIAASLARNANNLASSARELGIDRANLNRLAKRLGLK